MSESSSNNERFDLINLINLIKRLNSHMILCFTPVEHVQIFPIIVSCQRIREKSEIFDFSKLI